MTAATALLESNPDLAASVAGHCSGKLPEHINRAVDALHALEFDLSVAHQAIKRRAGFAIIGGADQPQNRCTG